MDTKLVYFSSVNKSKVNKVTQYTDSHFPYCGSQNGTGLVCN